ncbi:MAG: MFS transporter [Caldimicrobium sp.]|nr:MFS transporter [Caldimicrobium sp.]MDW8183427.1 MFS transporter [Caldimicrobium sp.]
MKGEILGPLQYRDFTLFIIGHFISFTGSWIQTTALHWLIYNLRHSTVDLGFFVFVTSFPGIFMTLLAGIFIDRFNRKNLMQLIMILSLIPPLFMFILIHFNKQTFGLLIILALFSSIFSSIDMPLRQVFISELVPIKFLTQALSLQAFSFNSARMLGPIMAGLIISHISIDLCFLINFLSFLPLLIFTYFIRYKSSLVKKTKELSIINEFLNFWHFLKIKRKISILLILISTFTFFATSVIILLPMLTLKILGGSASDFALLSSGVGIGALAGALTSFFRRELFSDLSQLVMAHVLWFLGVMGLVFSNSFPIYYIGMLLIGMSFTNFYPVVNGLLQRETPSELRGKVMSLFSIAFLGMAPLGQTTISLLAEVIVVKDLLLIIGLFLIIMNLLILRSLVQRS